MLKAVKMALITRLKLFFSLSLLHEMRMFEFICKNQKTAVTEYSTSRIIHLPTPASDGSSKIP